jgi:hypothetical protein
VIEKLPAVFHRSPNLQQGRGIAIRAARGASENHRCCEGEHNFRRRQAGPFQEIGHFFGFGSSKQLEQKWKIENRHGPASEAMTSIVH